MCGDLHVPSFKHELQKWQPRSSAIKTILQRWIDDDRADDVWKVVAAAAGANLTPEEFIRFVVRAAMAARALPARKEVSKRNTSGVIAGQRGRVAEAFVSDRSPSEIADVLEDAAWQLRFREKFDTLLDAYPAGAITRRRDKQSRRAFSLTMVDFFKERCGKWMDDQAGVLLEIAFGLSGDDNSQEVRDYRKASGRLDRQKPI